MAADPAVPSAKLILETQKTPTENIVRRSGKITSATSEQLQAVVRGLIPEKQRHRARSDVDSSGLGSLMGFVRLLKKRRVAAQARQSDTALERTVHHDESDADFRERDDMLGQTHD
jgi:anti-anti-sigma regulatory factor